MFEIYLPIAHMTINALHIILLGAMVGFLAVLFGGGFIMTQALNIVFGIPMNVAVGSALTQIAATPPSGRREHMGISKGLRGLKHIADIRSPDDFKRVFKTKGRIPKINPPKNYSDHSTAMAGIYGLPAEEVANKKIFDKLKNYFSIIEIKIGEICDIKFKTFNSYNIYESCINNLITTYEHE